MMTAQEEMRAAQLLAAQHLVSSSKNTQDRKLVRNNPTQAKRKKERKKA
jgi:hypothetical protein